jgi:hypothetical protein
MVERLTTFIKGFRLNDHFRGSEPGLFGSSAGFEVGVLVRFPQMSTVDPNDVDKPYLLWGNGNLLDGNAQAAGWAIVAFQDSDTAWTIRFMVAFPTSNIVEFVDWSLSVPGDGDLLNDRTLFVHGHCQPDGGNIRLTLVVNGSALAGTVKNVSDIQPADTAPGIGSGVVIDSNDPPIEPRIQIAGVCYREGLTDILGDEHAALVFERVQEVDDITQLPDEGSFQWDNIWSARRRFNSLTENNQVWNDLETDAQLVRTGNGGTLAVSAAKAHYWSNP